MKTHSTAPLPYFNFKQKLILFRDGILRWGIHTYCTADELIVLHKLATLLPPNAVCVEIGSYIGASSLVIAKGLWHKGMLHCIDPWINDAMSEGNWDTYEEFMYNTRSVRKRIVLHRAFSYDAVNEFKNDSVDFIFIDGDHSYDAVKRDVINWLPKVKSGGVIAMHDIGWDCGVLPVINELVENNVRNSQKLPNLYWAYKK